MLVAFSVANFLSFNEMQEFTLTASDSDSHPNHIVNSGHLRLLRFSSIYGPNASGKSNFVKAINYSRDRVCLPESENEFFKGLVGDLSHRDLYGNRSNPVSSFQYTFAFPDDCASYVFGFDYNTSKNEYVAEWLVRVDKDSGEEILYNIDYSGEGNTHIDEHYLDCFEQFKNDQCFLKESFLMNIGHLYSDTSSDNTHMSWILKVVVEILSIGVITSVDDDGQFPIKSSDLDALVKDLHRLDTGITGYRLQTLTYYKGAYVRDAISITGDYNQTVPYSYDDKALISISNENMNIRITNGSMFLIISDEFDKVVATEVQFVHSMGINAIPYCDESEGTKRMIRLLLSLRAYDILFVDEFECNIHALAVQHILRMYLEDERLKSSQLVISTHDSRLLSYDLLRRDEIWFVDFQCESNDRRSVLYSLDSFEDDSGLHIDAAYLDGRFGAIPYLSSNTDEGGS